MKKIIYFLPLFFLGCSQTERDSFTLGVVETVKESEGKSPEEIKIILEKKYEEGKIKGSEYAEQKLLLFEKELEERNISKEEINNLLIKFKETQAQELESNN